MVAAAYIFLQWPLVVLQETKNTMRPKKRFPHRLQCKNEPPKTASWTPPTRNTVHDKSFCCMLFFKSIIFDLSDNSQKSVSTERASDVACCISAHSGWLTRPDASHVSCRGTHQVPGEQAHWNEWAGVFGHPLWEGFLPVVGVLLAAARNSLKITQLKSFR